MNKIIDGLYLGDISGVSNLYQLRANVSISKSTHLGHHTHLDHGRRYSTTLPQSNFFSDLQEFMYKCYEVLDMPQQNLMTTFGSAIEFIIQARKKGGTVLVHCYAGISRSATIVIAYLMSDQGMSLPNAFKLVKGKRIVAFPNPGF